jgi:poly(3-hydroxybutyrate) depolymerase
MKFILPWLALAATTLAAPQDGFINEAKSKYGAEGENAARFLVEHMPENDKLGLTSGFLMGNLDLARQARAGFPWAGQVPEEIYLNDVLPYAVFDEPREAWRAEFLEIARPIVKGATTATEAAQALNREFFKRINVHYNTGRKRPNQSPGESRKIGMASCTGLAIILVDACRAVGIPARAAGTPLWANGRGNHTWVEIWDGGWHFTGADEFDKEGLDRGWFTGDAAQAKADVPAHSIYATTWKRGGLAFPLVWAPSSKDVAAVNVTHRYARKDSGQTLSKMGVRLSEDDIGDKRIVANGCLTGEDGQVLDRFETKAGPADLNDMPSVTVTPGTRYRLRFQLDGGTWETATFTATNGESTRDVHRADLTAVAAETVPADPLSRQDAQRVTQLEFEKRLAAKRAELSAGMETRTIQLGDKRLRWEEKAFGKAPAGGHSLWISMHGGGGAPTAVNDQQWKNQINLYQPTEGIYLAPRAPADTWNLWHESHIDPMFQRLIEGHIALRNVNPDKIYLMGYSAGGDGVWQLAPRMADRFAAAAMMAGHPNEASLSGLRNLPFALFMGADDAAYDRNKVAIAKTAELAALAKADPGGYLHLSRIYEGTGHWMNRRDAEALPWMARFSRNPWPKKVVWQQDDVTHDRFYWLKIPDATATKAGQKIVATVDGQTIRLEGDVPAGMELRLSDELLDLDQSVEVQVNGKQLLAAKVPRTTAAIRRTLEERLDLPATATAVLRLP